MTCGCLAHIWEGTDIFVVALLRVGLMKKSGGKSIICTPYKKKKLLNRYSLKQKLYTVVNVIHPTIYRKGRGKKGATALKINMCDLKPT